MRILSSFAVLLVVADSLLGQPIPRVALSTLSFAKAQSQDQLKSLVFTHVTVAGAWFDEDVQ